MTIVEEIDKKSNRPHRTKNIVDAMKYANSIASTPQNIAEAVKKSQSSGGGSIPVYKVTFVNTGGSSGVYFPDGTDLRSYTDSTRTMDIPVGFCIELSTDSGSIIYGQSDNCVIKYTDDYHMSLVVIPGEDNATISLRGVLDE